MELVRKRVKNVNLRVRGDGSVVVSAPPRVPLDEIMRFIDSKDAWIQARVTQARERAATEGEARICDGGTVLLWGQPKLVRVVSEEDLLKESVELMEDEIVVHMHPSWHGSRSQDDLEQMVVNWQAGELSAAIATMLPDCERRVGKRCRKIRIKRMKSRWGSCNTRTGDLSINLELVERPLQCLEQVLIHELCHLWEANHSTRFYGHMDQAMPGWKEARALLKQQPPRRG